MYKQHKMIVVQAYHVHIGDSVQMWSVDRHILWRVVEKHYTSLDVDLVCVRGPYRTTLTFRAGELLNVTGRMRRVTNMNMSEVKVRTLPERKGFGLFDPGEPNKPGGRPARWVGRHGEVLTPYAAAAYPTADEARQALREMIRGGKK